MKIGEDDIIKSLGLSWKPVADEFRFEVGLIPTKGKMTKRMLLSDLNRIFDPLGFLAPILVRGKIFIQQLWQLKVHWDSPLSDDLVNRWQRFYLELRRLDSLPIPRKCIPCLSVRFEIHGFCDASQEAYGAAIYIRSHGKNGHWCTQFLCAKTRVAPLKGSTIPRLELSGALILARLALKVAEAWNLNVKEFYFWTDSTVVLGWLKNESCRLKTFVANRVNQILEITEVQQWRHVRTDQNQADILSRGIAAENLQKNSLWWNGPSWLATDSIVWKEIIPITYDQELPEQLG